MSWLWIAALLVLILAAGVGAFFAFSNGKVYVEILEEIFRRLLPSIKEFFKPSSLTPADREYLAQKRKFRRGGR